MATQATPATNPALAATVFDEAASEGGFFRSGAFLPFLESGERSDLSVVDADGSERRLHSIVVCAHSGFFRAALAHGFKETAAGEVRLGFPDPRGVWPDVLRWMYGGKITIESDNLAALYAMASQLDIARLRAHCEAWMAAYPGKEGSTSFELLEDLRDFPEAKDLVMPFAAKTFGMELWNEDLSHVPIDNLAEFLVRDGLSLVSEFQRFFAILGVTEDARVNGDAAALKASSELLSLVKFPLLPAPILEACKSFPYVPRQILNDSAFDRLRRFEQRELLDDAGGSYDLRGFRRAGASITTPDPSLRQDPMSLSGMYMSFQPNEALSIELPFPVYVKSYSFRDARDGYGDRMIRWVLEGRLDPSKKWKELDKRTDGPPVIQFAKELDGSPLVQLLRVRPLGQQEKRSGATLNIANLNMAFTSPEEKWLGEWAERHRKETEDKELKKRKRS